MIADESCTVPKDIMRCAEAFDGMSVTLAKYGGITPALRMIRQARSLGMSTMLGCMLECTVGISAAADMAPLVDLCDWDATTLLAQDIGSGAVVCAGRITFPGRPGAGFSPDADA